MLFSILFHHKTGKKPTENVGRRYTTWFRRV